MTDSNLPDTFGAASGQDPFQAAKASAMKAAEELRAAATQKANEFRSAAENKASHFKATAEQKAGEYREYAGEAFSGARDQYSDLKAEAEKFAREKPIQAILTAFGVGLFVGLVLRK